MRKLMQDVDGSLRIVDDESGYEGYGFGFEDVTDFFRKAGSYIPGLPGGSLTDLLSGKVPSFRDMGNNLVNPFAYMNQGGNAPSPRPQGNNMLPKAPVRTPAKWTPPQGFIGANGGMVPSIQVDPSVIQRIMAQEAVNRNQAEQLAKLFAFAASSGFGPAMQGNAYPALPQATEAEQPYGLGSVSIPAAAASVASLSNTPTTGLRPARLCLQGAELTGALGVDPLLMLEVTDIRINGITVLPGGAGVLPARLFSPENPNPLKWTFEVGATQPFSVHIQNRHATLPIQATGTLIQDVSRY